MAIGNELEETLHFALERAGIQVEPTDIPGLARAFEIRRQRAATVHSFALRSTVPAFNYCIPEAERHDDD